MTLPADLAAMHAAGMNLLPISSEKVPMVTWKDRQDSPLALKALAAEFRTLRPPIVANICGQASDRWTLDFDGVAGRETYERLGLDEPHRETPNGGRHLDVDWPTGLDIPTINQRNNSFLAENYPGLDLRGSGGYANVYGGNGLGNYAWLRSLTPEPFSVVEEQLPQLVQMLYDRQRKSRAGDPAATYISTVGLDEQELRRRVLQALGSKPTIHDGLLAVGRALCDRSDGELHQLVDYVWNLAVALRPTGRVPPREEIARCLVDGASWARDQGMRPPGALKNDAGRVVAVTPATEVKAATARFVDPERMIVADALTLTVGDPGLGKSTLKCLTAARVSTGAGGYRPGHVLFITAEDSLSATLVPRLKAAGANLAKIGFVQVQSEGVTDGLRLPDDVQELARQVEQRGAVYVVIDPLSAHLQADVNSWRDTDVRRALAPLARMAESLNVAVDVVAHLNKSQGANPLYRVGGSIANVGAARSVILLSEHPQSDAEDDDISALRVAIHLKSNVSALAASIVYRLEPCTLADSGGAIETSRLVFVRRGDHRASDVLDPPKARRTTELDRAVDFLVDELDDGLPHDSAQIKARAAEERISTRTLQRACEDAGVQYRDTETVPRRTLWSIASVAPAANGSTEEPATRRDRGIPAVIGASADPASLSRHISGSGATGVEVGGPIRSGPMEEQGAP